MKIAIVYGKGLDGCGVQRGGVEMTNWARKNNYVCDNYYVNERTFVRGSYHDSTKEYHEITVDNFETTAKLISDNYDIVILNSYPSPKHSVEVTQGFYKNFVCKLEKCIVVGMMHEISKTNIDRIPNLFLLLNRCDIVMNFSEKTYFSQKFSNLFKSKTLGERTRRFKLWTDVKSLRSQVEASNKPRERRLTYMGRWSTMKDPRRVLDMTPIFKKKDLTFNTLLIGIEKSIGAKTDILDHPMCNYVKPTMKYPLVLPDDTSRAATFGPYRYDEGAKVMAESMFGASFYRLLTDKHNYGDRMEYTQIEMIALGAIPVFDIDFGMNNFTDDGNSYYSVENLAVWSDRKNLENTVNTVLNISDTPEVQDNYREAGFKFIEKEFSSDKVLPSMLEGILKVGKDSNKFDSDFDVLSMIYNSSYSAKKALEVLETTPIPLSFAESENNLFNIFHPDKERARIPYQSNEPKLDVTSFME